MTPKQIELQKRTIDKYAAKVIELQNRRSGITIRKRKLADQKYKTRKRNKLEQKTNEKAKLKWKSYSDYLASKEWQILRQRKLNQTNFRCQICNKRHKSLNIHHRTYARIFNERMMDLTVLCPDCHSLYHQTKIDNKLSEEDRELKIVQMLKAEGYY